MLVWLRNGVGLGVIVYTVLESGVLVCSLGC